MIFLKCPSLPSYLKHHMLTIVEYDFLEIYLPPSSSSSSLPETPHVDHAASPMVKTHEFINITAPHRIDDTIHLDKEKSKTDAEYYRIAKQAEANKLLLTTEFLELRRYETMSANQKVS